MRGRGFAERFVVFMGDRVVWTLVVRRTLGSMAESLFAPPLLQFLSAEVGQACSVSPDPRRQGLTGHRSHPLVSGKVGVHIERVVGDASLFKPVHSLIAPAAKRLDEKTHPMGLHLLHESGMSNFS